MSGILRNEWYINPPYKTSYHKGLLIIPKKLKCFFSQSIWKQAIRKNIIKTKLTQTLSQTLKALKQSKMDALCEQMNALNVNTDAKTTTRKAKLYYPRSLSATDFKGLTFAVWILRQMSNKGMLSVEDADWMGFLRIGADQDEMKSFYERFNAEHDTVAEEVSELLKKKTINNMKKSGRKPKNMETMAKYEGEATLTEQLLQAAEVEEKPKRKYTKKAKADVVPMDENGVPTEVVEKPKCKYTKKPKDVIENHVPTAETRLPKDDVEKPVAEPVAEPVVLPVEQPVAEKPKRKYTKKAKDANAPKQAQAQPEIEKAVGEKPKRKYTKKAKEEVKEPTPEPVPVQVITNELTKESFVEQPEVAKAEDEDEISVEIIAIEGVKYYLDSENNLYDIETQEPLNKKYINGKIL